MFYSHEVLTSRKHGVATVWLVATLGNKSALKKVTRKNILDVDVRKACDTIAGVPAASVIGRREIEDEEGRVPLALRLQGSLLYGVVRVYNEQCGYVLSDVEAAKANMRTMLKVVRATGLEAEGKNKGRADQLLMPDDPNFLPDFDLLPGDLEGLNLDAPMNAAEETLGSLLSPYDSQDAGSSQHTLPRLEIPRHSSSLLGGPVGGFSGGFSLRGDSGPGTKIGETGFLEDDLGIEIQPDGTMRFSDVLPRRPTIGASSRVGGSVRGPVTLGGEDEAEIGALGQPLDDDGFMPLQDDYEMGGAVQHPPALSAADAQPTQQTTSETAEAPLRRRARQNKTIPVDESIELRNQEIAAWNTNYIANMHDALRQKQTARLTAIAKQNAAHWVLGTGTLDRGDNYPLAMFSGANLIEAITGRNVTGRGKKRARENEEVASRRVRSRSEHPSSDELGRGGYVDDGFMPMMADDTMPVEQGRQAQSPLDDRHQSSIFPWNQSEGSRRPTGIFTSASHGAGAQMTSRRGSRMPSESPLVGRGGEHRLSGLALPGADFGTQEAGPADDNNMGIMDTLDAFEMYGPAAQVETQMAEQSQWQRAALDGESENFLTFVQARIQGHASGAVDFETLLPPARNSRVVAAQGLSHVLTLGTKGLLSVEQGEAFGEIMLSA